MNKALWEFSNTYRRYVTLRRFLQIVRIVIKFFLRGLFRPIMPKRYRSNASNGGIGERVRLLIEELGPTFIKFGQILSTRGEAPPWLRDELKKLQDIVPPFSYAQVEDIIEEEMAAPIEELFVYFNKVPIAAASLGQVHEARLRMGRNRGGKWR